MNNKREKKLLINTFVLALGQFFPQLTALITLPIYTGCLSQSEYGRYDLINVVVYILNVIVILQIHQAVFRFLIDVRGTEKEKTYISNTVLFELGPAIISSIIFAAYFYSLNVVTRVLLGCYLFLNFQNGVTGQIARGMGKNVVYALGAIVHSVLNMALVVVLVAKANWGFDGLFMALDISILASVLIQIIACRQWEKIDIKLFDQNVIKEMITYSWPMVPNTLSIWVVNTCDKFIIRAFLGIEYNGIFAAAQKIPSIFTLAYSTFNLAWQESASISVRDSDYNTYYNEVFSAFFDFLTGCMLLLIASSPILFKILIKGDYELAYYQIPLLYIGVFLSCISSFLGSIYIARKATKEVGVSSAIGAVINAVINLGLVHWAGLYAASLSTIISYFALVIYRVRDVEKKNYVHINYNLRHIVFCICLIVVCSTFCYMRNTILDLVNLSIGIVGFVLLNKSFLLKIFLTGKEKLRKRKT